MCAGTTFPHPSTNLRLSFSLSDVVLLYLEYEAEATICENVTILGKVCDCVELGSEVSESWFASPIIFEFFFYVFLSIRRVKHGRVMENVVMNVYVQTCKFSPGNTHSDVTIFAIAPTFRVKSELVTTPIDNDWFRIVRLLKILLPLSFEEFSKNEFSFRIFGLIWVL